MNTKISRLTAALVSVGAVSMAGVARARDVVRATDATEVEVLLKAALAGDEGAQAKIAAMWPAKAKAQPDPLSGTVTAADELAKESVHSRASAGAAIEAASPWKVGQEVAFMWMPAGVHSIQAGFRGGGISLTVEVRPEDDCKVVQASLDSQRLEAPKQKPFGCFEHEEKEASVWASGFEPRADGVYLRAEPSQKGADEVNGKVRRSWSPSFTTDAAYSKCQCAKCSSAVLACKCQKPALVFPDGVRGSTSNPARITGVDFVVGTLTNKPAFRAISPVKASEHGASPAAASPEPENVQATWSDAAREAAKEARSTGVAAVHESKSKETKGSDLLSNLIRDAHQASAKAYTTGKHSDHRKASDAHEEAQKMASKFGASQLAKEHDMHSLQHARHGDEPSNTKATDHGVDPATKLTATQPPTINEILASLVPKEQPAPEPSALDVLASGAKQELDKVLAALVGIEGKVTATWSDAAREAAIATRQAAAKSSQGAYAKSSNLKDNASKEEHAPAGDAHNEAAKLHKAAANHPAIGDKEREYHNSMAHGHEQQAGAHYRGEHIP